MGLSRNILLGAYISIPTQHRIREVEARACEDKHHTFDGDKFCRQCGKPIKIVSATESIPFSNWDYFDHEELVSHVEGETTYLMANVHLKSDLVIEENKLLAIDPTTIAGMIEEFSERFKAEIKILQAELKQEVKVGFGLLYRVY